MIFFSEYAFSKLIWFRNNCNENNVSNKDLKTPSFLEVSLMGVSESDKDINYITDFLCIPQEASGGLTEPTDEGMAEYLETMLLDKEISIIRCGRFWAHTHPGADPTPSGTDNSTFKKWFENSDIGVMYILAEDDDSCTVKNTSKYFGCKRELMDTYVVFNRKGEDGTEICLPTKTLFAINKIGKGDNYEDISFMMSDDYSEYYPEWMEELKKNVKEKSKVVYKGQYNQTHINYGGGGEYQGNHYQVTPEKKEKTNTSTSNNTKDEIIVVGKTYGITVPQLIELLINFNKETVHAMNSDERREVFNKFNVIMHDVQTIFNRIKLIENGFKLENLMPWEKELITLDGKSNFESLTKSKLIEICKDLMIRPICLEYVIKKYIEKAFAPFAHFNEA